jgi:hypothetical protein
VDPRSRLEIICLSEKEKAIEQPKKMEAPTETDFIIELTYAMTQGIVLGTLIGTLTVQIKHKSRRWLLHATERMNYAYLLSFFPGIQPSWLQLTVVVLFVHAVRLYLYKSKKLFVLLDIFQLLSAITRSIVTCCFIAIPGANCKILTIMGGILSQYLYVLVWAIQWIKVDATLSHSRKWTRYGRWIVSTCLVLSTAATFPWILSSYTYDAFSRCLSLYNRIYSVVFYLVDFAVNLLLNILFISALLKHMKSAPAVTGRNKFKQLLKSDARAMVLDCVAAFLKFLMSLSNRTFSPRLTTNLDMDWIKPVATHWFVSDVLRNKDEKPNEPVKKPVASATQPHTIVVAEHSDETLSWMSVTQQAGSVGR